LIGPSESPNLRKPEPPLTATPQRVRALKKLLSRLLRDTGAQSLVEYGLLLMMVSLASVAAVPRLACELACVLESASDQLDDVLGAKNTPGKGRKPIPPGQQKKCSKKCS
jgi:Flp pilus assembly pilin Flp